MKIVLIGCALLAGVAVAAAPVLAQVPGATAIEKKDPVLDALISPGAKLELVATGFGFTEGATWVQQGQSGHLLFSDIPVVSRRWLEFEGGVIS